MNISSDIEERQSLLDKSGEPPKVYTEEIWNLEEDEIRTIPEDSKNRRNPGSRRTYAAIVNDDQDRDKDDKRNPLDRPVAPASAPTASLVFCVHGNKFGFARCCDDLNQYNTHFQGTMENPPSMATTSSQTHQPDSSNGLHCHTDRTDGIDRKARKKLIIASILCVVFMIMEAVGGVLANSLAIATDAAHLLTDFASFLISLLSLWVASRPATKRMSFGWHRAEVMGAVVSVLMIWVVTGILLYMAIMRMVEENYEIQAEIMLITSGIGVIVNIIMGTILHQHDHSHGGGHSHGGSDTDGETRNINVRAAYIHVIGDFIQSLGVFVAALMIYFEPTWGIADPICTILFSILVLYTTLKILRDTVRVLMEGLPKDVDYSLVEVTLLSVPGIVAVHNLRIWSITTEKKAIIAHLAIQPGTSAQDVLKSATWKLREKYNFFEMTLQVEDFQEQMDNCSQCKNPA